MKTKEALIFAYAHFPEKCRFLANPPEDMTKDKYSDKKYLRRVIEMIVELKEKDFKTRPDGILPYSQERIIQILNSRIFDLEKQKVEKK